MHRRRESSLNAIVLQVQVGDNWLILDLLNVRATGWFPVIIAAGGVRISLDALQCWCKRDQRRRRDRRGVKGVVLTPRELRRAELPKAANLLARGMCDNPIIIRVFRISDTERRARALERFFVPVLAGLHQRGLVCGAFSDGSLVGVCGMVPPGNCRPKFLEVLGMLPSIVAGNRADTILRIKRWVGEWARRDLDEPHWHLGPVAVDPRLQGQGIGTELLTACCLRLNDHSIVSYLETDKYKNVRFYRKFGFDIIAEAEVLGVPTWFMSRPSIGSTHSFR